MLKGFEVLALDKNYTIVSILRYTNLQWRRKYYQAGTFSIEIPLEQYDPSFKYIYTYARPEMGYITQVNYIVKNNYKAINLSGYFLENLLNGRVAFAYANNTNITNQPTWINQKGNAETVAYAYFNGFKDLRYTVNGQSYTSSLGIAAGTNLNRGHTADHERGNQQLGHKIYTILKPSKMSYRVKYDFLQNTRVFEVWSGKDRRQDNTDGNNPVIFSTRYGNLSNPDVLLDISNYYNSIVTIATAYEGNTEQTTVMAYNGRKATETTEDDKVYGFISSVSRSDYASATDFKNAMLYEGEAELVNHDKTTSIEFDSQTGSYEYMKDFDLGDICSLEIHELGLSADAVLVGCTEVIKKGVNTLTMEFDTPQVIKGGL